VPARPEAVEGLVRLAEDREPELASVPIEHGGIVPEALELVRVGREALRRRRGADLAVAFIASGS